MMRIVAVLMLSAAVTGCAYRWSDPAGAVTAKVAADERECRYEAKQSTGGGALGGVPLGLAGVTGWGMAEENVFADCMRARGNLRQRTDGGGFI